MHVCTVDVSEQFKQGEGVANSEDIEHPSTSTEVIDVNVCG